MAKFGCCVERGTFGGGGPSTGLSKDPKGECSPFSIPPVDAPNLSLGKDEWPEWMSRHGCGYISLLMHDQIVHKDKMPPGMKLLTPKISKEFKECLEKCSGFKNKDAKMYVRDDSFIGCMKKCKEDLMLEQEIFIEPKIYRWGPPVATRDPGPGPKFPPPPVIPDAICPPLCVDTQAILAMVVTYTEYLGIVLRLSPGVVSNFSVKEDNWNHMQRAKVKGCSPAKEVCFDTQDYSPQTPRSESMCVGPEGKFLPLGWSSVTTGGAPIGGTTTKIRGPGECQKIFDKNGGRGKFEYFKDPQNASGPNGMGRCVEIVPEKSYIDMVYIEPVVDNCPPRPDGDHGSVSN